MSDKKQVKVIEFEGIDASGKSTQMNYFVSLLKNKGYKVLTTREVGSQHIPICSKLREVVLDPNSKLDGKSMEFIFAAMRIENQKFYESVKNDYDFIVSDRGYFSHLAYTDHNVSQAFTERFYVNLLEDYTKMPDMVVYLDVDPIIAQERMKSRNGFTDAIEAKGAEFQAKVAHSFNAWLTAYEMTEAVKIYRVDANLDLEHVEFQIREELVSWVEGK